MRSERIKHLEDLASHYTGSGLSAPQCAHLLIYASLVQFGEIPSARLTIRVLEQAGLGSPSIHTISNEIEVVKRDLARHLRKTNFLKGLQEVSPSAIEKLKVILSAG